MTEDSRTGETEYVLTKDPAVLERAHTFCHARGFDTTWMCFPTIIAIRDKKVVGVIGTQIVNDTIVAGPFVVELPGGHNGMVPYRLVEKYFTVMRNLGITEFYAFVDKDNLAYKKMLEALLEVEPFRFHEDAWWYRIHPNE